MPNPTPERLEQLAAQADSFTASIEAAIGEAMLNMGDRASASAAINGLMRVAAKLVVLFDGQPGTTALNDSMTLLRTNVVRLRREREAAQKDARNIVQDIMDKARQPPKFNG